jgi:hypothetical protein
MSKKAPPDRGRFAAENIFDSLGEEEAGENVNNATKKQSVKENRPKRVKFTPWEFSPTLYDNGPKTHEGKYLVIETTEGPALTDLSVFTVEAVLENIASNYISADKIRDGKILLLTKDSKSAKQALAMTEVKNICKIRVTEHVDLNQVKGTIYCEELLKENLEVLKEKMKKHKVVDIRRITKMENGKPTETPLHILTFASNTLETSVKVGWKILPLRKYYPSPLKCTKCLILGHTRKNCAETEEFCRGCALPRHEGNCVRKACRNCPNTENPHSSHENCPKMIVEKSIIEIKEDMKIPYFKARLEYQKRVEKAARNEETNKQIQQQQEMYRNKTYAQIATQDDVQQQILKTLEVLQRKIENLEKNTQHSTNSKPKPKRKQKASSRSVTCSSSSDEEPAVEISTPKRVIVGSQQTVSQNINEIQSNISNTEENDNNNVFDGNKQSDGTITENQTQYQIHHLHDNNINQDYNSSNITDFFLPISNQNYSTMQQLSPPHHPIIQQQQLQRQQDTMDFEEDNKAMKRPNPAQSPTQSTPSIDGKKNKIPKN